MMYYYGSGWGMPHQYGFGFLNIIFWILVIVLVVKVIRKSGHHGMDWMNTKSAVDILKERYAKGEINKEQFESMKKDLKD